MLGIWMHIFLWRTRFVVRPLSLGIARMAKGPLLVPIGN